MSAPTRLCGLARQRCAVAAPERPSPARGEEERALILVCEDEADLLEDLSAVLTEAGYVVLAETSAEAALARLDSVRADVILSDITLPGIDGMTFLRRVRQTRPDLNDVPFILLTGFADRSDILAGKRAGADDYLVKPVDYDLLVAAVDAQLRLAARIASVHGHPHQDDAVAGLVRAVNRLDFGLVLLDMRGRICFSNRAARRLSEGISPPTRNWLRHAIGEADYMQSINAAYDSLRQGGCHHSAAVISQDIPQDNWRLVILSDLGSLPVRPGDPMMMALILGFDAARRLGARLIAQAAGLTAGEAAVADLLARGLRLKDIADQLAISLTTVNFHLRNIFQKTMTSRQADLMLLLRSVPLAECPHCTGPKGQAGPPSRAAT